MKASEVRQSFLEFFQKYDHQIVPSAPVVPRDDPTLFFINAGMNQFKDIFLGTGTRPYKRAVDSQKCIRVSGKHNDLEEVGRDSYHHTFFEMLGNWSFGDYYKEEAIRWAWELITDVWSLPKERLWATVFREDDEAEALWKRVTDIKPSHVLRFDEKDNFWEMGETGPCGPCSEIHIDLGDGYCDRAHDKGHQCGVNQGCARVIELWNLVFIQFNRDEQGRLTTLPSKHVDTGMGLERAVAVLQGKGSNYHTDLFVPLLDAVTEMTGHDWRKPENLSPARVITDHIRALAFAVTDGAIPSNEGRGYVLRRILRRAARYGRTLGMHEPFLYRLVAPLVEIMGQAYPEVAQRASHTELVIRSEEERFNEVLDRGLERFGNVADSARRQKRRVISGADAFALYDTYGFPLDLTELMAREQGLSVDTGGFEAALEDQRARAREAGRSTESFEGEWETVTEGDDSHFEGYAADETDSTIRKIKRDGDRLILLLDRTPFYAEAGGQIGDQGVLEGDGFTIEVDDTRRQGDQILHFGRVMGTLSGSRVRARVHKDRRLSTARNHTATHLLHRALKQVLGEHVNQAGSLVAPDRLRFDFTHFEAPSARQLDEVEKRINEMIRADLPVEKTEMTLAKAKKEGATALFGEKYGERVRVVRVGNVSMELCGGIHLERSGQIGVFRILQEESVAAGVRRIEAVTGQAADTILREEKRIVREVESLLRCRSGEIIDRLQALIQERKTLEKAVRQARKADSGSLLDHLLAAARDVEGIRVVAEIVEASGTEDLRVLGDRLRETLKSGVGVLGTRSNDKVQFLAVVTDDLIRKRQLKAGDIVREVAKAAGGSGGGRPHLALAGAKETEKLQEALNRVPDIIKALLT
ncbi:MAG TPA: alanine--tRNA ligase [bacterium]|nr:alanine--tRNA ligase [bacterium]